MVSRSVDRARSAGQVEAAWAILRSRRDDTAPLRPWAQRVALRRGTKVGIVALARKLEFLKDRKD